MHVTTAPALRPGNRAPNGGGRHARMLLSLLLLTTLVAGCATSRAFGRGNSAARAGEWDVAVEQYRTALSGNPDNAEYRIALQRAMGNASVHYQERGRVAEARGQLEEALRDFRRASEYDPTNRQLANKVMELDRKLRQLAEASQPPPSIQQLREAARQAQTPALFRLNEVLPALSFTNASVRDILNAVGKMAGINVTYERDYQDPRPYTLEMEGVTLEQALNQITVANQLFYKVLNPRTIMIINDNQQKRLAYDELMIKVLRLSHADATEVSAMLLQVVRIAQSPQAGQFFVSANKTQNTLTIRAPVNVATIAERLVAAVDKPRAEVVVEVEILEVRKQRLKEYGLDLGNYRIGAVFSPESDPRTENGLSSPPFNLNSVQSGVDRGDFYLAVPSAAIRFLETDSQTKLLAKSQLRGSEGQKMTLNLGEEVPVPTTVYTPIAQGGANVNPLSSFNYRTVGIVLEATPRVTYENEIMLEMIIENSARGADANVGGSNLPTFATRKVTGQIRLRDGEPNLLAGLLQENDRRSLSGIVGLLRLPVIKQLFSANDRTIEQTDIIVLLTPRIIRSHELTQADLEGMFIGTTTGLGLNGPPPLIEQPPVQPAPAPGAAPGGAVVPQPQPGVPAPPGAAGQGGATAPAPGPPPVSPLPPPGTAPEPPQNSAPPPPAPGQSAVPQPGPTPFPAGAPVQGNTTASAAASPAGATSAQLSPTGSTAGAQIVVTPASTDLRAGSTGYPLAINALNASRLSSVSLTITYNPAALRVRSVQQGSFMTSAGGAVAFTKDEGTPGRVDIVLLRTSDATGATGSGLLASILVDAVGAGPANIVITGTATAPGGAAIPLQFAPVPPMMVR